ncbi:type I secretion system permease/ATPase [Methylocystis iwaonis]|uniref:ABC transporter ATP-binding protein/permease n=1 Tax=Methylocystis iwaonis TaxID=2885079 RepID=A0ABN6VIW6_9HYPH|nr:type I secretion system permease/ATPase [Methylocystis iwaonis]BDV35574.1 ABC transporter ATP-binding protein/permease [Methylocystis iwaonis]
MTEPGKVQSIKAAPRMRDSDAQDPLLDGLLLLCQLYNRPASASELTAGLPLDGGRLTPGLLRRAGARVDLDVQVRRKDISAIVSGFLPVLLLMKDGSVAALLSVKEGKAKIVLPDLPTREMSAPVESLMARHSGLVVLAAPLARRDSRADGFGDAPDKHWFWDEIKRYWPNFLEVAFAAGIANLLAIATSLFAKQVYDRVVPNLSFATLWVLALGVGLAIVLETVMRILRAHLMDVAGRRLDLTLSARLFERALGLRLEARPRSVGSFASQLREMDAVREFFTSATIGALSDIPFLVLFIVIVAYIGGPIAIVLACAVPLIVVPGVIAQWPISALSQQHLREGAVRHGLLMEALSGIETVKSTQAEGRFQRLWEEYTALLAQNGVRMRTISSVLMFSATAVQQIAYVLVMVVGVYRIADGEMTVGALLACSILSSRTIAPLTQLAGIFARWQHMRAALDSLDALMESPVDRPADRKFVHRPRLSGNYRFENVAFTYDKDSNPALQISALSFEAGASTALLGANGSGKSTLLKIMAGLYHVQQGQLLLDGAEIRQIDPADVRKSVAYLPQDVRLFHGTLRDNLRLGLETKQDEELLEALAFVGAEGLVQEHPLGLDRMITEGGGGVSGGQRQSVGLARIWLRDPRIVLLDEPTAAIDHALELVLISRIREWAAGRTLVVATHRQPVLALTQRAIVLNAGRPAAHGPVEGVLAALASNRTVGPARHPQPSREAE